MFKSVLFIDTNQVHFHHTTQTNDLFVITIYQAISAYVTVNHSQQHPH